MPRRTIVCPICSQITDRPPQHLRVKHNVPKEEIPAMVMEAKTKVKPNSISLKDIKEMLPRDRPTTLMDVVHVVESTGCTVTGQFEEITSSDDENSVKLKAEPEDQRGHNIIDNDGDDDDGSDDDANDDDDEVEDVEVSEDESTLDDINVRKKRKYKEGSPRGKKMKYGLYEEISDKNDPQLAGYRNYLNNKKRVTSRNQLAKLVKNISWLFEYCQGNEKKSLLNIDLASLTRQNFSGYMDKLKDCDLKGTSRRYVHKAVNHFVSYIETCTDIDCTAPDVFEEIRKVGKCSEKWQSGASRDMLKEEADKRYNQIDDPIKTPYECREPVRLGEKEAKRICGGTGPMTEEEHLFLMRYCMSIIICWHGQRPMVIEKFKTAEYLKNKTVNNRKVFTVREHKTESYQPAQFSLSMEHFNIFQIYHQRVQETFALMCQKKNVPMRTYFFVRYPSGGEEKAIGQASLEFRRFQKNTLKMPDDDIVTATMCRKAIQTAFKHGFKDTDKSRINEYLAHSGTVADKYYRLATAESIATTGEMIDSVVGVTKCEPEAVPSTSGIPYTAPASSHIKDCPNSKEENESAPALKSQAEMNVAPKPAQNHDSINIPNNSPPRLGGKEAHMEDLMFSRLEVTAMKPIPTLGSLRSLFQDWQLPGKQSFLKTLQSRWAYQQRKIRRQFLANSLLRSPPTEENITRFPLFKIWGMNKNDITAIAKLKGGDND